MNDEELKFKCLELAVAHIGTSESGVVSLAREMYSFLIEATEELENEDIQNCSN